MKYIEKKDLNKFFKVYGFTLNINTCDANVGFLRSGSANFNIIKVKQNEVGFIPKTYSVETDDDNKDKKHFFQNSLKDMELAMFTELSGLSEKIEFVFKDNDEKKQSNLKWVEIFNLINSGELYLSEIKFRGVQDKQKEDIFVCIIKIFIEYTSSSNFKDNWFKVSCGDKEIFYCNEETENCISMEDILRKLGLVNNCYFENDKSIKKVDNFER